MNVDPYVTKCKRNKEVICLYRINMSGAIMAILSIVLRGILGVSIAEFIRSRKRATLLRILLLLHPLGWIVGYYYSTENMFWALLASSVALMMMMIAIRRRQEEGISMRVKFLWSWSHSYGMVALGASFGLISGLQNNLILLVLILLSIFIAGVFSWKEHSN